MLRTFAFHVLSISYRINMRPNENQNWTVFVEEQIYLSLAFKFFSITEGILLEYLKNFIFGTLKKLVKCVCHRTCVE